MALLMNLTLLGGFQAQGCVLVAERGGCSFVQKAYIAQIAGAVGLIVYNIEDGGALPLPNRSTVCIQNSHSYDRNLQHNLRISSFVLLHIPNCRCIRDGL